jgi:hypothetical protein
MMISVSSLPRLPDRRNPYTFVFTFTVTLRVLFTNNSALFLPDLFS